MNRRSAVLAGLTGLAGIAGITAAVPMLTKDSPQAPAGGEPSPDSSPDPSSGTGRSRNIRLMPLGDSTAAGSGSSGRAGYRLPLELLLSGQSGFTVDFVGSQEQGRMGDNQHEGHPGYTIDRIRAGADRWIRTARPDVVLVSAGLNDLNQGDDPEHAADQAQDLVERIFALRPEATVIQQGLVPSTPGSRGLDLTGPIAAYNQRLKRMETELQQRSGRHFRYVKPPWLTPADRADASMPAELADGLHPNDMGYEKVAEAYYEALEQAHSDGWFG
ncbi:SGNH/GDSL hydrolase family protein [Streptomyces sp. NPDC056883]|uniref:SGNH/GDSL hydrolase family protein n=1 Tax=Streptomyces sp. NPDC056883 TaxID=3345959 RepID=UPI0036A40821